MKHLRAILDSKAGKIFGVLWSLSGLAFVGVLLVGVADEDVASSTPIAVLVAAPFIDLAIFSSYWAAQQSRFYARATWLFLSAVLIASTVLLVRLGHSDADVVMTYAAVALSFPVSLIGAPLGGHLASNAGSLQTPILWAITTVLGYVQWFVVAPRIVNGASTDRLG